MTRVYLPSTLSRLRGAVAAGEVGPGPLLGHAVTDQVRRELADAGEEEWEYAASSAAALASVALLGPDEPARRVVIAVDVPAAAAGDGADPTQVRVEGGVPLARVAAVLADAADAQPTVSAARDGAGAPTAEQLLERCLGHELGWWATQEIGELLRTTASG